MTISTIEKPAKVIRDMLAGNWDISNTIINSQPRIHTGNIDDPQIDPQIAITNLRETTESGGAGYNSLTATGGGKKWNGTVDADISTAGQGFNSDPEDIVRSLRRELKRIIHENSVSSDFQQISTSNTNENPSGIKEPSSHREIIEIDFTYFERKN